MRIIRIRIQIGHDITLCKKLKTLFNIYFGGEGEKQKKPPNKGDEKEFPEGKNLKQDIKGEHKTYKEMKRRYKTKLRMLRSFDKLTLAQKTEI